MQKQALVHLGRILQELRSSRDMSGRELARRSGISQSNISKFESGIVRPSIPNLKKIAATLELSRNEDKRLFSWHQLLGTDFSPFLSSSESQVASNQKAIRQLENSTRHIRAYQSVLVPGLLQTEDYMRAVFETVKHARPNISRRAIADAIGARKERQQFLQEEDKKFSVVLHENALLNRLAPPEILHEQISHLLSLRTKASFTFGLIPSSRQWEGRILMMSFDLFDRELALMDAPGGLLYLWMPEAISDCEKLYETAELNCLHGDACWRELERIQKSYE